MAQLRQGYQDFVARGAQIIVVGPEDANAFRKVWQQERFPFVGLPDPGHSVLRLYGQRVNLFKLGRMPAQAIVDREGIVRYAHYGHSMADIPSNEELLAILDELNARDAPATS